MKSPRKRAIRNAIHKLAKRRKRELAIMLNMKRIANNSVYGVYDPINYLAGQHALKKYEEALDLINSTIQDLQVFDYVQMDVALSGKIESYCEGNSIIGVDFAKNEDFTVFSKISKIKA